MVTIETSKINNAAKRAMALKVIENVYLAEKKWISSVESEIPDDYADSKKWSWFLATVNGKPAGVLRLQYDPSLDVPPEFELTLNEDIDLKRMAEVCRFVEIGRFMILPRYRKNYLVAVRLMRSAAEEVVARDYTHFITDVFEGEVNSPLNFHTRILGFDIVGKHLHGELNCRLTRIVLTLDILKAYRKLNSRKNRIARLLTDGIREVLEKKVGNRAAAAGMS